MLYDEDIYLMLTDDVMLLLLLERELLACAGNGTAVVGVTLSAPFDVRAAGMAANGLVGDTLVGVTTIFSFITCCDCFSFFNNTSLVSSFRRSSRKMRKPFSRSFNSAGVNSLMGT